MPRLRFDWHGLQAYPRLIQARAGSTAAFSVREVTVSSHLSPAQIRASLDHPIVDGDGHWLEYAPVFSDKMRKAGGDLAADGFLAALRSTTDALKMTPEERRHRRVAMPNFWNRQAENTLDRATAMMPKML